MRSFRPILLCTTLAVFASPVLADLADVSFDVTDRNGDQRIDRREFQERMVDVFFLADTDKDGFLLLGEVPGVTAEAFQRADLDGNGKLDRDEFANARARDFDAADRNGDGALEAGEVSGFQ